MGGKKIHLSGIFKTIIGILIFCCLLLLILEFKAKNVVENFLTRKIPSHIQLSYSDLNVSVFKGNVQFSDIRLNLKNRETDSVHTAIKAKELRIDDLSFSQFTFNNSIAVDALTLGEPSVKYYPSKTGPTKDTTDRGVVKLLRNIKIDKLEIVDGSFEMTKKTSDSILVKVEKLNFTLNNSKTGPEIIKEKIPIVYSDYKFSTEAIFVDLGPYETVTAEKLYIDETNASLTNTLLRSKYSKAELSKEIKTERDHIDLSIPGFSLNGIDFGFNQNRFYFKSTLAKFDNIVLDIYRDKLVADDFTHNKMYSTLLRELPLDLSIDSLAISNGYFTYGENVTQYKSSGSLFIDAINGSVKDIDNTYPVGHKTVADINGKLMGDSPLNLVYKFDMNNTEDAFTASAKLFNLQGSKVNSFLEPNLNVRIEGEIKEMYFTVYGDAISSKGDMKMRYRDLKFTILKKDRKTINKFLSAVGNLFINDGSKTDADGYRYGPIVTERDPTKSFFNFIWKSTSDGLLNTIAGSGKKKGSK